MTNKTKEILKTVVDFIESIVAENKTEAEAARTTKATLKFQADLLAFNKDPSVTGNYPFLLGLGKPDEAISEIEIDKIIFYLEDIGLGGEVVKRFVNGYVCGFLGHKALSAFKEYTEKNPSEAKVMNIQTNGIVTDNLEFLGFYTAKSKPLIEFADMARAQIASME